MSATVSDDDIYERYLERAIREINDLGRDLAALSDALHVPVLGSGHPLGDVFLLKHKPRPSEIAEGVAFSGRAGVALLKSIERLGVDGRTLYGTNCFKFGTEDPAQAADWLRRELAIVQPRLLVAMGAETVAFVNALEVPLSTELDSAREGELQPFTPTLSALVTPDIDESLDEQAAKTRFWNAFRPLGTWWAQLPPY